MTDFFAELEEDIREERLFLLWRKYGNLLIGIALSIILATAAYTLWQYLQKQNRLKKSADFTHAVSLIEQGKKEAALSELRMLSQGGGGYGKLAQLYEATLLPDPKAPYAKIIQENTKDNSLGNLAKILLATQTLGDPTTITTLEPLTAPQNAWNPIALELLALINLKAGKSAEASKQLIQIVENHLTTSSEQMRARMELVKIAGESSSQGKNP